MTVMNILVGAIAMALLAGLPSSAQGSDQVVNRFEESTISQLLLDVGADFSVEGAADSQKLYRASTSDGLALTLSPRSCSAERGCSGLLMISVFTRSDGRSLAALDNALNRHNDLNPNAKVYRTPDGTVVLQGYINAAHGISSANARAQLLVFGQEIAKVREALLAFSTDQ